MTDYRDSTPMHFPPPKTEWRAGGEPLYPEKWPELVADRKDNDGKDGK